MLVSELDCDRRLGVEYECAIPQIGTDDHMSARRVISEILTANGVPAIARCYSNAPLPAGIDVAVESDSSVRGESAYQGIRWVPVEVKTRILHGTQDWERVVPKMLELLGYLGCRVNATTGHHIHVEVTEVHERPEVIRSLVNVFTRYESVLLGCVSPSRRDNSFCRSIAHKAKAFAGLKSAEDFRRAVNDFDRHSTINVLHLATGSPRVEVRMHQGTLDVEKARHWMRLCVTLVNHACRRNCKAASAPLPNDRKGLEKMLVTLGFKPNSKVYSKVDLDLRATGKYLLKRWKRFNGTAPDRRPEG